MRKALIRFFHLSPDVQIIDIGKLTGSTFTPLYTGRSFETTISAINNSVFTSTETGTFNFDVRMNGSVTSLHTYDIPIEAGKYYTLFLRGVPGNPITPLGIEVITHN